jgi:hypothetical protein
MAYWWEVRAEERFWCEITDRQDIGADLKCPQTDESDHPYWSYSLIHLVWPGDIVFHYSTVTKSFVGASVAGGPVESRPILWTPHGTVGRANQQSRWPRPGWWRPLYGFVEAAEPLTLAVVQQDQAWVRDWIEGKMERPGGTCAPFQLYPRNLRANQGYLTKMPLAFVNRWRQLTSLSESLANVEDRLVPLAEAYPAVQPKKGPIARGVFKPKSAEDYVAVIQAGVQRRSRHHESLVRLAGEYFQTNGANVITPHPIDLLMMEPRKVIFEAKITFGQPGRAIREAVGQLMEYKWFLGPQDALLAILLDADPGEALASYVEERLGLLIAWYSEGRVCGGPRTMQILLAGHERAQRSNGGGEAGIGLAETGLDYSEGSGPDLELVS